VSMRNKGLTAILALALAGLVLLCPGAARAAGAVVTLDQALDLALAYSPKLKAAQEALAAARFSQKEAFTYFLPTLGTSYAWKRMQDEPTVNLNGMNFQTGSLNTYQWSTYLSQPIFTGFRLTSTYRLAELGVDLAKLDLRLAQLDLVVAVKEAYLEYLRAQKSWKVAQQAVRQLKAHLKVSQDFYDVGIIPINDVLKTKVGLSSAQQEEVKAKNAVDLARSKLNVLLGRPVQEELEVKDILRYRRVEITYDQAHRIALEKRPELKALALRLEQADQAITQAQSQYYPQVSLRGAYNFTSDKPELGDNDYYDPSGWEVSTQVEWTFWEWGRTRHRVSRRRAQKRRLGNLENDLKDQVGLQVKQAILFLRESEKNIFTAKVAITQAKENYRITLERFKEQLTTNTELLDAQVLLTNAQNNYFTALTVYNLAKARLWRFMGLGRGDFPPGAGGAKTADM